MTTTVKQRVKQKMPRFYLKLDCIPVVKRNPTDTYTHPCIVWWQKGYAPHTWLAGELLCDRFPNGEIVSTSGETVGGLVARLKDKYRRQVGL